MAKSKRKSLAADRIDATLDAQLPDFVRAELAGLDAHSLFVDVSTYLKVSVHAQALRRDLLQIERRLLSDAPAPSEPRAER